MNEHATHDASVEALIDYIQRQSEKECAGLRDEAQAEATRALRLARGDANRAVRQAIGMDRRRLQRQVAEEAVRRRLRRREQDQADTGRALRALYPAVRRALRDLWQEPEARRRWIAGTLELAARRLAEGDWVVAHPADLDPDEVAAATEQPLRLEAVADQEAGLVVSASRARIDATPRGLTAREAWVQGLLLGCLLQEPGSQDHD